MKSILVLLIIFLSACQHSAVRSFADRVASAEALEKTPAGALFVGALVKEHMESMNTFANECYADSTLEKDAFTLVADIDNNGMLKNVVVQPESATTRCYAGKFGKLRTNASRPADFAETSLPLVIDVTYNK